MLIRKGRVTDTVKSQLYSKEPRYDNTDIPLQLFKDMDEEYIKISDCYLGVQHRQGKLKVKSVRIESFINDGYALWQGEPEIEFLYINHDLDFRYTRSNHSDCFHAQTNLNKKNIIIKQVELELKGKGSQDKGKFMFSEVGVNESCRFFEDGVIIKDHGRFKNKTPLINSLSFKNTQFGSPENPIDGRKIGASSIRIMRRKPNSPKSSNNVIHCYSDVNIEIDDKNGTSVRIYKRGWPKQDRLDNFEVWKGAKYLL